MPSNKTQSPITRRSRSDEQSSAEAILRKRLNAKLRLRLKPAPVRGDANARTAILVDGVDETNRCLCEIYAHIGKLKGSQPDKVAADMLKLVVAERRLGGSPKAPWRKIICFADADANTIVEGCRGWLAEAARFLQIEGINISLPPEQRRKLIEAQRRQRMSNRGR